MAHYEVFPLRTASHPFINYCYIVFDPRSRSALLIDPSWELHTIVAKLIELHATVKGILLTHAHYDHVNLAPALAEIYSCEVFMSAAEIEDYGFACHNLRSVCDGEVLDFGTMAVSCCLTPGHTSGSMCYFLEDCVFTGDTVFIEGCGGCDFTGSSAERMFESIQKIKSMAAPHLRVFPGHSFGAEPGATMAELMKQNIYFQIDAMHHFVAFRMRPMQNKAFHFR